MLRCPPSQISLNPVDIADFERRLASRRAGRAAHTTASKARLNHGPARITSNSFVPAEQNIGQKRAASTSSEAELHNDEKHPAQNQEYAARSQQGLRAFDNVGDGAASQSTTSHQHPVDSFNRSGPNVGGNKTQLAFRTPLPDLDGATDTGEPHSPIDVRCGFLMMKDAVLGPEQLGDVDTPRIRPPRDQRPLLSEGRARRRHGRSNHSLLPDLPLPSYDDAPVVPELLLPSEGSSTVNLALDPGAPVFVPRTRFGVATSSSIDSGLNVDLGLRWNSVDSTHSLSDLRLRLPSGRNSDFSLNNRLQAHETNLGAGIFRNIENGPRPRRRSRTIAQDREEVAIVDLERYPLLRPPTHVGSRENDSRWSSRSSESQGNSGHSLATADTMRYLSDPSVRSLTPTSLARGRSTPNLHHPHAISPGRIYSRGSSLSRHRSPLETTSSGRTTSTHSAASGFSSGSAIRPSSRGGLDAATEFLRLRTSPLDELTERLSRLSAATSRPRSVGRSWERPPHDRPRVSLLTGNPFGPDESVPALDTSCRHAAARRHIQQLAPSSTEMQTAVEDSGTTAADVVALSLALPPSSPVPSTPPTHLPSTPPPASYSSPSQDIPPSASQPKPPRGSPTTCVKRKPVPGPSKTPKVAVYDDSKPPETQPQTPAEVVLGSLRRGKARSDTLAQQSPVVTRHRRMANPPVIPERQAHRNAHPSFATTAAEQAATSNSGSQASRPRTSHAIMSTPHRRRYAQPSNEQAENDVEAHLPELEEDRRVWIGRQEGGNLDITPPRERRFERYLS